MQSNIFIVICCNTIHILLCIIINIYFRRIGSSSTDKNNFVSRFSTKTATFENNSNKNHPISEATSFSDHHLGNSYDVTLFL